MKKAFKKVVSLLLAVCMTAGATACSAKKPVESQTQSAVQSKEDRFKDPVELSIATWSIGDTIAEGKSDPVRDMLYKKFNMTIKPYPVTWGDYMQKIQVWAASKSLPDITSVDIEFTENFSKWASQGIISPIPEDLSKYPNIEKLLAQPEAQQFRHTDNKFYSIPTPNYRDVKFGMADKGIVLRKDWMKKVGVEKVPDNLDDLISLLKKFQTEDPDGNGKDDTIGITAYNLSYLTSLFTSSEPGAVVSMRWVYDKDDHNKWIPAFMSKDYYKGLTDIKKLFDAGVVDPDFAILKGEEGRDKFKSGKAGAYAHNVDPFALNNIEKQWATTYKNVPFSDMIETVMPFKHYSDNCYYYTPAEMFYSALYLNNGMDDVKKDRALALIDYLLSDEGYNEVSFGLEGIDHITEGGEIHLIEQKDSEGKPISMIQKYPITRLGTLASWSTYRADESPAISKDIKEIVKKRMEWADKNKAVPYEMPNVKSIDFPSKSKDTAMTVSNYLKDINTLMSAPNLKVAYDKMVKDYLNNGYNDIIKEVNEMAEKQGLKK